MQPYSADRESRPMPEPAAGLLNATAHAAMDEPISELQAALQRLRRRARRTLLVTPVICLCIAAMMTAIDGRGFGYKLLYSLCIGAICMGTVDLTRMAFAYLSDRLRRARGEIYVHSPAASGWRGVIPGCILAMAFGPPLGLQLGDWLTGFRSSSMFDFNSGSSRMTLAFSVVATIVSVVVLSTAERLASARAQAQAAQRLAAENQLRMLQSQLEPHMLFNTLANLRVLIGLDPARAQAMLDHLIAFLRTTLSASRSSAHPLADEFAHLGDYLALMAVRMGPRLAVVLDLPADLAQLQVPPLLLQPLVENGIKHGLEPKVEGGRIAIGAARDGASLVLTVRDTGVGLGHTPATAGTSFGLEQVRTRLATLYGERASLTLQAAPDDEGGVLATLRLPLDAAGAKPT
jgi:hypothetical protein